MMQFSSFKINVNPIQSDLDALKAVLPPQEIKAPEAFYPWNHTKVQGR